MPTAVIVVIVVVVVLMLIVAGCTAIARVASTSATATSLAADAPSTTVADDQPQEPATTTESVDTTEPETESTAPATETQRGRAGDTATIRGADGDEVAKVTVSDVKTATREPRDYGAKPERGLFVVFEVEVEATGSKPFQVLPSLFYVRGSDNSNNSEWIYATAWGAHLKSTTLQPGERVSGTLVFDVTPGARHGHIVFNPDIFNEQPPVFEWEY